MPADPDDWESGMQGAADSWKAGVSRAGADEDYAQGLANYLGVSAGSITTDDDWRAGVADVSESEFQQSIEGKGQKWADNFERGVTS